MAPRRGAGVPSGRVVRSTCARSVEVGRLRIWIWMPSSGSLATVERQGRAVSQRADRDAGPEVTAVFAVVAGPSAGRASSGPRIRPAAPTSLGAAHLVIAKPRQFRTRFPSIPCIPCRSRRSFPAAGSRRTRSTVPGRRGRPSRLRKIHVAARADVRPMSIGNAPCPSARRPPAVAIAPWPCWGRCSSSDRARASRGSGLARPGARSPVVGAGVEPLDLDREHLAARRHGPR